MYLQDMEYRTIVPYCFGRFPRRSSDRFDCLCCSTNLQDTRLTKGKGNKMIILFRPRIYIFGRRESKPPTSRGSSVGTLIPMNINRHPTQYFLSREIFAFYIITSQVILCYFDKFSMFTYSSSSCRVYHKASSLLQKLNVGGSRRHHSTRILSLVPTLISTCYNPCSLPKMFGDKL